jgi:hypothetical protein
MKGAKGGSSPLGIQTPHFSSLRLKGKEGNSKEKGKVLLTLQCQLIAPFFPLSRLNLFREIGWKRGEISAGK